MVLGVTVVVEGVVVAAVDGLGEAVEEAAAAMTEVGTSDWLERGWVSAVAFVATMAELVLLVADADAVEATDPFLLSSCKSSNIVVAAGVVVRVVVVVEVVVVVGSVVSAAVAGGGGGAKGGG